MIELEDILPRYSTSVPVRPQHITSKVEYFSSSVEAMQPREQRILLYDLCDSPPSARRELPTESARKELLAELVQADGRSPLAVQLSDRSFAATREHWFVAASRVVDSPAGAVTAARALLETTCKTILFERSTVPDDPAKLDRLCRQTCDELKLVANKGDEQAVHQILSGLGNVVNGLATLSNSAGDRHGTREGVRMQDRASASLAVHASGLMSLYLLEKHRLGTRSSGTESP